MEPIRSPPPPGSPLAYNEDEIVSLVTQIYTLMIALCYISTDDILFPPLDTGRHVLDAARCVELNLHPRVVSLLERLPFLKDVRNGPVEFYKDSRVINYLDEMDMSRCRDPHQMYTLFRYSPYETEDHSIYPGRDEEYTLQPQDVALTRMLSREGRTWILDTEANTLRTLDGIDPFIESAQQKYPSYVPERPGDELYYRNWPAFHAPSVLRQYIEDIRTLTIFPNNRSGGWQLASGNMHHRNANFIMKEKLFNEYGWPDNFRAEDWVRDHDQVLADAEAVEEQSTEGMDLGGMLQFMHGEGPPYL